MQTAPKQITVKTIRNFYAEGRIVKAGTVATYDRAFAAELIGNGKAVTHDGKAEPEPKPAAEPKK